jgi:predicted RNA binding protein YcfA (HicA-like mRNA interferase family)
MAGALYRELIRLLKEAGCTFVRQGKGSHEIWHSPITKRHFVVPFDVQKQPTVRAILRQAGISDER